MESVRSLYNMRGVSWWCWILADVLIIIIILLFKGGNTTVVVTTMCPWRGHMVDITKIHSVGVISPEQSCVHGLGVPESAPTARFPGELPSMWLWRPRVPNGSLWSLSPKYVVEGFFSWTVMCSGIRSSRIGTDCSITVRLPPMWSWRPCVPDGSLWSPEHGPCPPLDLFVGLMFLSATVTWPLCGLLGLVRHGPTTCSLAWWAWSAARRWT